MPVRQHRMCAARRRQFSGRIPARQGHPAGWPLVLALPDQLCCPLPPPPSVGEQADGRRNQEFEDDPLSIGKIGRVRFLRRGFHVRTPLLVGEGEARIIMARNDLLGKITLRIKNRTPAVVWKSARPARRRPTAIAIKRRQGGQSQESHSARSRLVARGRLADEGPPRFGQCAPQLADPGQPDPEMLGRGGGLVPQGQELGQPAITAGKGPEPIADVDSHLDDLGRSGPPVLDNEFFPCALFRIEPVQTFDTKAFPLPSVAGEELRGC